jgi:hypothetical protein
MHSILELIFVYDMLNNASPIFVDLLAKVKYRVGRNLLELIFVHVTLNNASPIFVDLLAKVHYRLCSNLLELYLLNYVEQCFTNLYGSSG